MQNQNLEFPVLIGDIGGTNMRFSLILNQAGEQLAIATRKVDEFPTIEEAIRLTILPLLKTAPKSLFLAIAGPVTGDHIKLTNCDWVIAPKKLIKEFGFNEVFIINDFEAQALSTVTLPEKYLQAIGPINTATDNTKVIIGAGSGLGIAGLIYLDGRYIPIEGEGGHVDYAPQSEEDLALYPFLKKIVGRVSAEELLSGRGLLNIYRAFCDMRGVPSNIAVPEEVTAEALLFHQQFANQQFANQHRPHDNPAFDAVRFFINYLARLAGDFALVFKAEGGVYIGGGILPEMLQLLDETEFRKNFIHKQPHEKLLETIATFIILHPRAALVGMESYVRDSARFMLDKEGRFRVKNLN